MEALREPELSVEGEAKSVKCLLCSRDAVSELCRYHLQGKESLETAYPHWVKAYGILGWKDYLDRVKRNVQTGQWAKETAEMLAGR